MVFVFIWLTGKIPVNETGYPVNEIRYAKLHPLFVQNTK